MDFDQDFQDIERRQQALELRRKRARRRRDMRISVPSLSWSEEALQNSNLIVPPNSPITEQDWLVDLSYEDYLGGVPRKNNSEIASELLGMGPLPDFDQEVGDLVGRARKDSNQLEKPPSTSITLSESANSFGYLEE